jgi:signal transduction histidine kinase
MINDTAKGTVHSKKPRRSTTSSKRQSGISPKLLQRYQLLFEIARDLASTLDLNILLNRIVDAATELTDAKAASILLYDQINAELHFEAATNMDEPLMRGLIVPVDASIAGWVVKNRQPLIIEDTDKETRHFDHVGQVVNVHTKSLIGVPLITKDKVIGALEVINKQVGTFSIEDQNLLTTLAAQAAVAIENSRLFLQSDLISELVHELRTPMASLSTAAHLLLRPDLPDDQRQRIVEIIRDETFRISELASSFLDLARLESGRAQYHPELTDIKELLLDCVDLMRVRAVERDLKVSVNIPKELPKVKLDRDKIKQVLINLISNAVKYNNTGGKLGLNAKVDNNDILVEIWDTGAGIPSEYLPNLFQKFYRVPGSELIALGTGLGLAICKQIMDAHRGRIEVNSLVGEGTKFIVHLPLSPLDQPLSETE